MRTDLGGVYKRLETDQEFATRIALTTSASIKELRGRERDQLDDWVWGNYRRQRRIVEDVR